MNKRQAKKAFKKKYGCTPNQYAYKFLEAFSKIDISQIAEETGRGLMELFTRLYEAYREAMNTFLEALDEIEKEMKQ